MFCRCNGLESSVDALGPMVWPAGMDLVGEDRQA